MQNTPAGARSRRVCVLRICAEDLYFERAGFPREAYIIIIYYALQVFVY